MVKTATSRAVGSLVVSRGWDQGHGSILSQARFCRRLLIALGNRVARRLCSVAETFDCRVLGRDRAGDKEDGEYESVGQTIR